MDVGVALHSFFCPPSRCVNSLFMCKLSWLQGIKTWFGFEYIFFFLSFGPCLYISICPSCTVFSCKPHLRTKAHKRLMGKHQKPADLLVVCDWCRFLCFCAHWDSYATSKITKCDLKKKNTRKHDIQPGFCLSDLTWDTQQTFLPQTMCWIDMTPWIYDVIDVFAVPRNQKPEKMQKYWHYAH